MKTFSLLVLVSLVLCLNASPRFLQSLCPQGDFWPNPDDAHSYYQCNEGTPLLVECYPSTLFWNQALLYCDWTAPSCVESSLWADPNDNTQYYQCVNGVGVLNQCQTGLVWNQDALYCDYPASATCVESTFWADDTDPTQYYQCVNGAGVLNQACLKSISLEYLGIILY